MAAQTEFRRRAKPGAVIEGDELPPTFEQLFDAGYMTEAEYVESLAMRDHFNTLPLAVRQRGVTLTQAKRDPRFQSRLASRLAAHAGITRTARPVGAARERRDSASKPSRGGDSGDSSDEPEPGPGSGRLDGPDEIERWLAEREATLRALIGSTA